MRDGAPTIGALVAIEGTPSVDWARRLRDTRDHRDLTDAAHVFCAMYGAYPCLIDSCVSRGDVGDLAAWLLAAAEGFAVERGQLVAIAAAAGPSPSTPGQARTEAAIAAQRHALEALARSDRAGCAIGAAIALTLDWRHVRPVLEVAATRGGVVLASAILPDDEPAAARDPGTERARLFGARQLLTQQRGLWSLLEARSLARNG